MAKRADLLRIDSTGTVHSVAIAQCGGKRSIAEMGRPTGQLEFEVTRAVFQLKNLAAVAGEDPDAWLVQLLEEYVSFALFRAGSLLSRESEAALAGQVAEVLKPVRSLESTTTPPPSLRMQ